MTREASPRGRWILIAGVLLGALVAGLDLVRADEASAGTLEDDVVARVDGHPIPRERYERALAAVAADRRGGSVSAADRARVLDRLVEEELLVQEALALGLAERDRRVRADLAAAAIDLLVERATQDVPDDATLRRFYEEESGYFRAAVRVRVRHAYFPTADEAARGRLALASGRAATGDAPPPVPLPQGLVSLRDLTAALGPTAAREVASLEPGEASRVIEAGGGYHVVTVLDRREGRRLPFERARVLGEYRRRAGERALRDLLRARRAEVEIVVAEGT